MFKLLPEETRAKVAGEYKLRRSVVIVTSAAIMFAVALGGLFPSYILSKVRQTEAEALLAVPLIRENEGDLGVWLTGFNRKLHALSAVAEEEKASLAMERALAERRAGIRITQLNWSESEGAAALSLVGVASDRQALLSFETRLKDSGNFSEVMLPVSNLAKESNISFQINLSLKAP
jgi:hypothetical protein